MIILFFIYNLYFEHIKIFIRDVMFINWIRNNSYYGNYKLTTILFRFLKQNNKSIITTDNFSMVDVKNCIKFKKGWLLSTPVEKNTVYSIQQVAMELKLICLKLYCTVIHFVSIKMISFTKKTHHSPRVVLL